MIRSAVTYKRLFGAVEVDIAYGAMSRRADETILATRKVNNRPTMFILPMQGGLIAGVQVMRSLSEEATYRAVAVSLYDADNQVGQQANFDYWPITEEDLKTYNFIVIDDVAESLRTYQALRDRLAAHGALVHLLTLVDKPVAHRVPGMEPDFAPLTAKCDAWLVGEGMNDGGTVEGQSCRLMIGVWEKIV